MLDAYLETLPEAVMARLFASPAACVVVLRMLPPLARAVVMRLLYAPGPEPLAALEKFLGSLQHKLAHAALARLRALKVLRERYAAGTVELHRAFRQSLRAALTSGPANEGFDVIGARVDAPFLAAYHAERWERMLNYMVSSADHAPAPQHALSPVILELLTQAKLLGRQRNITSDGFQFLLQPRHTQVWTLLLHYLNHAAQLDMDPIDVLNFLFRLSMLESGCGHAVDPLAPAHKRLVHELAELGVVYLHNGAFYAAVDLSSDGSAAEEQTAGFIIVETNYRVYAYTSSPLQISILSLFCSVRARFANLVLARFTRTSARRALSSGITADQIIQYLSTNHRGGRLPPMIVDQIKLWQLEMDRFTQQDGVLFKDFAGQKEYALVSTYAQDIGALLWKSDKARMFFVDEKSAPDVSQYVATLH